MTPAQHMAIGYLVGLAAGWWITRPAKGQRDIWNSAIGRIGFRLTAFQVIFGWLILWIVFELTKWMFQ